MYDPKFEAKEFVGDSAAEAIAKATSYFARPESELRLRTLSEVSGLGARALVVAAPLKVPPPSERRGGEERGGRERERSDRGPREGRERGGRERRPERGERSDRGERAERRDFAPEAPVATEPSAPSVGVANGEVGPVGQYLLGVVERMDLGPFEVSVSEQDGYQIFEITGDAVRGLTAGLSSVARR